MSIRKEDRAYAGGIAAVLLAAHVVKNGFPPMERTVEVCAECARGAAQLIVAVDRHVAPKERGQS